MGQRDPSRVVDNDDDDDDDAVKVNLSPLLRAKTKRCIVHGGKAP